MTLRNTQSYQIKRSISAQNTFNPIRAVLEDMKIQPNPDKHVISLSIGDPTIFGNLKVDSSIEDALIKVIKEGKYNGYAQSQGIAPAREAIAKKYSTPEAPLTADDIVLGSGCSGALELVMSSMVNPGQNLLIPRPGFSLYETIAGTRGFEVRFYDLLPEKNWEIDFNSVEALIDENTVGILVNNPSNPCGSVYSREHLVDILELCHKYKLPVIADEIYGDMTFGDNKFYPMASLTQDVPIISVKGLAKQWLVPGWRVGWLMIHDRHDALVDLKKGIIVMSQVILGANTLIQAAIPDIIENTPEEFYQDTIQKLEHNAKLSQSLISEIPGLVPVVPQGAMYMMVEVKVDQFKDIKNDVEFTEKLMGEESVFCLPAKAFGYPNFFRIVICPPPDQLEIAYQRMKEFCERHSI